MTETLSGLLTPVLAIVATVILVLQYVLAKRRWRLDLYDKRYPVFLATMQYLSFIGQHASVDDEELFKFLRNSKDKEFLFGNNVQEYLEQLYKKGVRLNYLNRRLDHEAVDEKRTKLADELEETLNWFSKQFEVSKALFGEYLKIDKR